MTELRFFDRINERSNGFASASEDYFYLEGISGRLGFRKFTAISAKEVENSSQDANITFGQVLLNIVKIASYFLVVPLAVFLISKAVFRSNHKFSIALPKADAIPSPIPSAIIPSVPPSTEPENVTKAKQKLEELYAEKRRAHWDWDKPFFNAASYFTSLQQEFYNFTSSGRINPDGDLSNLAIAFRNDPVAHMLPYDRGYDIPGQIEKFKEDLSAAFMAGKQFVVARFGNNEHAVAAAFQADGRFKLIDSWFDDTINIQQLTQDLNAANVTTPQGKVIRFSGEYINTHLQRRGNVCLRFATLYCYHMAKKRDLEAYQEVNGAFLEGRLQRFEDHEKIDGAKKVKVVTRDVNWTRFMDSWFDRRLGLAKDDWRDISMFELALGCDDGATSGDMAIYMFTKDRVPAVENTISRNDHVDLIWKGPTGEIVIKDFKDVPLERVPFNDQMSIREILPKTGDKLHCLLVKKVGSKYERCFYRLDFKDYTRFFRRFDTGDVQLFKTYSNEAAESDPTCSTYVAL